MKHVCMSIAFLFVIISSSFAQGNLSIDNVYKAYLRNSGTIMENNQIKGYFFLYQSDKVSKKINEYTLQILDQNLNKVKDLKFEDSKNLNLLEAAYNNATLAFLFKNSDDKTLDMKIFDLDGKLKYSYSREYDKRTNDLMTRYETMHTDEGTNQNVFNVGDDGYVSILPLRDGKQRTYEVDFFSSAEKKQWIYTPEDDEEKYANAEFLGSTDSLIILEVLKKSRAMSGKMTSQLVGLNFRTKKKAFELDESNGEYKLLPSGVATITGRSGFILMGSYFNQDDNIVKDPSKGIAFYTLDGNGKVLSKTYNSWEDDFSKYLPLNKKGKIDKVGFVYIHKLIHTPSGKTFIVSEGYKRQASAGGIALNVLAAAGGGKSSAGVTKIVVTDMVVMELNDKYKVTNATIYDKTNNTVEASQASDFMSQHAIAMMVKMTGGFDYEFTTADADNSTFTVCYRDFVRSSDYKGETFNSIRFNGNKFSTDKIELKSKSSRMKVFPAKAGSVMIMEYFKKDKRIDFRLEKLG